MKRLRNPILIALAVPFTALLIISVGWTKGFEQPPGDPPFGVAIQSDAQGTKLRGVIFIGLFDPDVFGATDVVVLLRLRRLATTGEKDRTNLFRTFYAEGRVSALDPGIVQAEVTALIKPRIIDAFFGNNNGVFTDDPPLQITVQMLTEFGHLERNSSFFGLFGLSFFNLADITIAVK